MTDPPKHRFPFRLRTLMIVVTLLAVPLGYVGWQAKIVRERKAMLTWIKSIDGVAFYQDEKQSNGPVSTTFPWIRRQLGDEPIERLHLPVATPLATRQEIRRLFPEIEEIWAIVGDKRAGTFGTAHFPEDATAESPSQP